MATKTSLQGDMRDAIEQFTEEEEGIFQWTKQWYPVAVVDFLDPSRPHATQLLGKDIVLWRDGSGKWRCFEDFCPHRLAPLSEGRVESDGTLMCAYHAWRFDSEGNCVSIPQSKDKQTEARHCSNPKSCAVAYPTQERQGKWLDTVYTPNPQDKMVIAFRQWLEKRAGGGIPWASGCSPDLPPAEPDKQKLFDVWTTHTQHCRVCQDALKNINRFTVLAYVAAVACLCLGIIVDSRAVAMKAAIATYDQTTPYLLTIVPPAGFWWALGGAILFATVGYLLKKLSRLFYVYEFEHAHND